MEVPNKNQDMHQSFEQKALKEQVEKDHKKALRAAKLGKSLVKKTVRMIEKGKDEQRIYDPRLWSSRVDNHSTSLALNAELREKGLDIEADVVELATSTGMDGSSSPYVRIRQIEGKEVNPPSNT